MSTRMTVTKGVRLRTAGITSGNPAEKAGEWLVTPYRHTAPSVSVGAVRESTPDFARRHGTQTAEQMLADIVNELVEVESLEAQEEDILVVSADDSGTLENARLLIELLGQRLGDLEKADMERIIEAVVPSLMDRPPPAFIDQARRNAEARTDFMGQYEMLDADQLHALYGSKARNRSALAARWRSDKKIFAVQHSGRYLYPAFQFDAQGRPRKMISKVLAALGATVSGWQTALWFVAPNGWLAGEKPVDLLDREPGAVLDAAADVAEPIAH